MKFGSVCSGIEAASVAWLPLGYECAFMSEIAAFPRAVLAHHYPETPLHGDFTTIQRGDFADIDVLVGGTPCQSFSIAGLRGGLGDARGNLALEYLRLAERLQPRWICWENVPGVLSSTSHDAPDPCQPPDDMAEGSEWVGEDEYDADESHAFACFLAGLSEIGYGWAYRSFDAQYFGLPSGASVCSLSDILETGDVPQRFFLSPRACAGILRRAEKRGKELPPQLARALRAAAGLEPTLT